MTETFTVSSVNQVLLDEYLALAKKLGIFAGPLQWKTVRPYHPTYWKELPQGYEVEVPCREKEFTMDEEWDLDRQMSNYTLINRKYTNPFGDMFWPLGMDRPTLEQLHGEALERLRRTRPPKLPPSPLFSH